MPLPPALRGRGAEGLKKRLDQLSIGEDAWESEERVRILLGADAGVFVDDESVAALV
jgi:hypothetical protein